MEPLAWRRYRLRRQKANQLKRLPDRKMQTDNGPVSRPGDSEITKYYEEYWSAKGYRPAGHQMDSSLAAVFARHLPTSGTCIDVGCGDGALAGQWLARKGFDYQGVDVSANAISEARAAGLRADVIEDASVLPFPADTFDAAICVEVLEHLFLPLAALEEMLRILKPGGVLIVTTPNVAYWRRRLDLALLGRWNPFGDNLSVQEPWRDPHIRFFSPGSLRRCLARAGFTDLEIGAHEGTFLADVPWIRHRIKGPSHQYRFLRSRVPSLLGNRLYGVGLKPQSQDATTVPMTR